MATDTDVIVTQYRARFAGVPFSSYSCWQLTGAMEHRQTLTRRRRRTVVADVKACNDVSTDERALRVPGTNVGHIHESMIVDEDARILFVPDTPGSRYGVGVLVEQVKRTNNGK